MTYSIAGGASTPHRRELHLGLLVLVTSSNQPAPTALVELADSVWISLKPETNCCADYVFHTCRAAGVGIASAAAVEALAKAS